MSRNNLLHDIEPQPGAVRFRGVQRREEPRHLLGGNATASIMYLQGQMRRRLSATQGQRPTLRHGVDGILHEVEQRPAERTQVQQDYAEICQTLNIESDALGGTEE